MSLGYKPSLPLPPPLFLLLPLPPSPEVFQGLQGVLERLRGETFTWDEDINFVQETLADPDFLQLCEVNDGVAESQSFEQPVASLEDAMKEVQY